MGGSEGTLLTLKELCDLFGTGDFQEFYEAQEECANVCILKTRGGSIGGTAAVGNRNQTSVVDLGEEEGDEISGNNNKTKEAIFFKLPNSAAKTSTSRRPW